MRGPSLTPSPTLGIPLATVEGAGKVRQRLTRRLMGESVMWVEESSLGDCCSIITLSEGSALKITQRVDCKTNNKE